MENDNSSEHTRKVVVALKGVSRYREHLLNASVTRSELKNKRKDDTFCKCTIEKNKQIGKSLIEMKVRSITGI